MDARSAIEEARRLKAEAEKQIASDMTNVLFDLEGRTGMNTRGVRVYFSEVTGIEDYWARFIVSNVEIDLGKI